MVETIRSNRFDYDKRAAPTRSNIGVRLKRGVIIGAKKATLAAVAARAGVSVSTASLAFSGAGPVAEATRRRVLGAAAELGYCGPDPRARSLRQGRSGIIAVVTEQRVLDAFRDPVGLAFLDGIGEALAPSGRALLLVPDAGAGRSVLRTAPADAMVLIACSTDLAEVVDIAAGRGVPLVSLGGSGFPEAVPITLDDERAATTLAEHLAELGHRRIAVVTLPLDARRERGPLTPEWEVRGVVVPTAARLAGTRRVFADPPAWVAAGSLVDEGYRAGCALLVDAGRPTAIIAQSDLLAAGVIRAAEELGLRVPEDLSVAGFDGVRLDTVLSHDLTTMVQPAVEQGRAAGAMAIELVDGGSPEPLFFSSVFHRGATTAPPAGG